MKNIFYASFVAYQPCAFSSISCLALVTKFNPWFSAVIWPITKKAVSIYNDLSTHFSLYLRKPAEVHLNPNLKYKPYRRNKVNLPELTI